MLNANERKIYSKQKTDGNSSLDHPEKSSNNTGVIVVLLLSTVVVVLLVVVVVIYWYKRRERKTFYKKVSVRHRPKLTISLPHGEIARKKFEKQPQVFEEKPSQQRDTDLVVPATPATPSTPYTPFSYSGNSTLKYSFNRSISVPSENVFVSKDRDADGLWRQAVKKASATQFLTTKPRTSDGQVIYCANGKMKFSLRYNQLGQKELTVKLLEFIDLPLSRETGISVPFVKVYLYPQTAHINTNPEKNKSGFRVEILSFPRENVCSFVGCPIDKLCSSALKFVILDYDRFSRSEFVADCVILLDEVSLEGDAITKHLSIRRMFPDKDVGSLLLSLCYQPNGSRICIIVLKASGLPEGESGHFPDHFVKISLLRNGTVLDKRRTRVVKKNICPVFNESLVFPVDCHGTRSLVFIFDVIRYDSKIKQEKVASVILGNHCSHRQVTPHEIQHFNEMLQSPQRQIAEWHKLVV